MDDNFLFPLSEDDEGDRGSVTLESAITVPVVFLTVCLCVYILLLLFEHAQLRSAADYAATAVSAKWRALSPDAVIETGDGEAVPADGAGLYHRLVDMAASKKQAVALATAETRSRDTRLRGLTATGGAAVYDNGVLGKTLTVALEGVVTMPNPTVTDVFGLDSSYREVFGARSLLPDFAETQRGVDYVFEIEQKLEEESPEFRKVADGFSGLLDEIRGYIGGLF